MRKANIFLNFVIAADITIGAVLATTPYWYTRLPSTTMFYYSIGGCAAIFAVLSIGRYAAYQITSYLRKPKIKYYSRGRNYDRCRLGYISSETICEILRYEKNGGKKARK